jgi:hypothetical protein
VSVLSRCIRYEMGENKMIVQHVQDACVMFDCICRFAALLEMYSNEACVELNSLMLTSGMKESDPILYDAVQKSIRLRLGGQTEEVRQ